MREAWSQGTKLEAARGSLAVAARAVKRGAPVVVLLCGGEGEGRWGMDSSCYGAAGDVVGQARTSLEWQRDGETAWPKRGSSAVVFGEAYQEKRGKKWGSKGELGALL